MTGLYGPVDNTPHGNTVRDPSNWGGPVDARHAIPGDSSHQVPSYTATPYAPDPNVLGDNPPVSVVRGQLRDTTPRTHAAPYPAGVEQDPVVAAQASQILHGADLGGTRWLNDGPVQDQGNVNSVLNLSPEVSGLAAGIPDQLRSGSIDVDQGFGQNNSGTFGYGHQQRREFHSDIPFDRTTLNAGDRPFFGKHPVWQNRLDGENSPFAHAGDTSTGMNMGPTPVGYPTAYEQPSNPTVAPVTGYDTSAPVTDFGWVAG